MNDATDSCPLQAVEARRHDARAVADSASSEPEMLNEKSCRAAGDHRHPAIPGGQPVEGVEGRRERSGLAGVVQLVERSPELEPAVRGAFPELKLPATL